MSTDTHNDLEARLAELFDGQSRAMTTSERAWDPTPMATVTELGSHRARRRWIGGGVAAIAIAAAVVATLSIGTGASRIVTKPAVPATQPPAPPAPPAHPVVSWTSEKGLVKFEAASYVITVDGKQFTAQGTPVEIHSDPGGPDYWTLELGWDEHGVRMLMNIYFKSDGKDWWSDEIRTYNGKAEGDWIEYHGVYFKTPLGQPFVGDLDLHDAPSGSSVHVGSLWLQVNPAKFNCAVGTGTDAIVSSFERPVIELQPGGSEGGTQVYLMDRAVCAIVSNPDAYTFDWSYSDPGIALVSNSDCGQIVDVAVGQRGAFPQFDGVGAGTTTFHVAAKDKATGAVVGERDFAVTVRTG